MEMNKYNILKQIAYRLVGILLAPLVLATVFTVLTVLSLVFFITLLLGWTYGSVFYGWEYLNEI